MTSYVLITGAAGGLGKAFAAECASRGWPLVLTDLSEAALGAVAAGLERLYGAEALTQACDLTDPAARAALWDWAAARGLRLQMLINVAGIDFEGPFDERRPEELRAIVRLNVEATVEMTRSVLSYRDPARPLRIINVSSLASYYPMPVKAVYAASKRFLLDWSLALHAELHDSGVTVTALCPAGLPTNPSCVAGIAAQGLMGRLTTLNVGDVAARTLDWALAGRTTYIPGAVNQALRILGALVPRPWVAHLLNRRWRQARERRAGLAPAPTVAALVPAAPARTPTPARAGEFAAAS
jgi:short-subunit dehydrogenase